MYRVQTVCVCYRSSREENKINIYSIIVTVRDDAGREGEELQSIGPARVAVALVVGRKRPRRLAAVSLAAVGRVADRCVAGAAEQSKNQGQEQPPRGL